MNCERLSRLKVASICFALILFSPLGLATESDTQVRADLLALDFRVDTAFYDEADREFLDSVLSDNFIYVHSGASPIQTKSDVLNNLLAPGVVYTHKMSKMDDRIHGGTAIVSGFSRIGIGSLKTLKFHKQRVYVKKENAWKLVAQHVTFNLSEEGGLHMDVLQYIYKNYWADLPVSPDDSKPHLSATPRITSIANL